MNLLIALGIVVGIIGIMVLVGNMILLRRDIRKTFTEEKPVWPAPVQAQIEKTQMMGREMTELAQIMREKAQREMDTELAEYARKRRIQQPINTPMISSNQGDDRIRQTNPKAERILIPEHLSEEERQVLKDFFDL